MATYFDTALRPASSLPSSAAYLPTRSGDRSGTSFPWDEKTGQRIACGGVGVERNEDVVAGWLKALEGSFGTCARMISARDDVMAMGGGSVCRALDRLCGRRPLCAQIHATLHRNAVEERCIQQVRCPLGFLLVAVPIREIAGDNSLFEFGPLGVEQIFRAEFERGLSGLGLSPASRTQLQAPLNAVRSIRAEDIEGVLALLERVAALIADEMLRGAAVAEVHEPKAVSEARRYAELHVRDKTTLADVARRVALSPDHFSRLFRRAAGLSFGEYVNRCRITNACRLLCESSRRVAEISFACGFDSVPHFNRVFRRVTGTSPTVYRRQNGRIESAAGTAVSPQLQIMG